MKRVSTRRARLDTWCRWRDDCARISFQDSEPTVPLPRVRQTELSMEERIDETRAEGRMSETDATSDSRLSIALDLLRSVIESGGMPAAGRPGYIPLVTQPEPDRRLSA